MVLTLGCKLNQLESESLTDVFLKAGFQLAVMSVQSRENIPPPSIIIINTCTVTSKADQKARRVIRKALRDYPASCVIVTGCYARLNREELLKLNTETPLRLFVINKEAILNLPQYLNGSQLSALNSRLSDYIAHNTRSMAHNYQFSFNPEFFTGHTRSFLKIQDGCGKHCTYCRIRLARGPSVSLEKGEVLSRLRLLEKNHAEAVLTGVNISQYGGQGSGAGDLGLAELLDYLLSGTERIAIRLSSLAPDSIDEELAQVLSNKRIRPHFHLSVQSGSAKILEKMGRRYNAEIVQKAVFLLRSVKDDPFLACDIIAGFPGETEEDFEETFSLCEKIGFAWIHVFPYSKRPGTPSFSFTDNVSESEVTKRVQLFTELAKEGRMKYINRWIGREVEVLIENRKQTTVNREKIAFGTTDNYLKALIRRGEHCTVTSAGRETLSFPSGSVLWCKLTGVADIDDCGVIAVPVLRTPEENR